MMLFWILAITDLIMVGITWAVYGSSATYRDGMLLGVHLPESAISLSPVAQLTDNYQKHIRKFYLLHLVLGVVVAIPFFWLASIGITLWCIWFCVFPCPCSLFAVQCPPSAVSSEAGTGTGQYDKRTFYRSCRHPYCHTYPEGSTPAVLASASAGDGFYTVVFLLCP